MATLFPDIHNQLLQDNIHFTAAAFASRYCCVGRGFEAGSSPLWSLRFHPSKVSTYYTIRYTPVLFHQERNFPKYQPQVSKPCSVHALYQYLLSLNRSSVSKIVHELRLKFQISFKSTLCGFQPHQAVAFKNVLFFKVSNKI